MLSLLQPYTRRLFAQRLPQRLWLRPAALRDVRGGEVLCVWDDPPYWLVVDHELAELLGRFDGVSETDALLRSAGSQREVIVGLLRRLIDAGVLAEPDAPPSADPPATGTIANISINLTRRCNLNCRHCYQGQAARHPAESELSADEIQAFLTQVRPLLDERPSLTLLGGEPLMRKNTLLDVAGRGRKLGFETLVSTNGLAITPDFAAAARDVELQVQVSLDGASAETHNALRGADTFEQATAGVRRLVHAGVHTTISMVCHAGNVDEIEAYYALAQQLGVDEARFIPLKRLGGGLNGALRPPSMVELIRAAARMLARHPEHLQLMGRDAFSILATQCQQAGRRTSCGTGVQTMLLDADGGLYPCLNTASTPLLFGNIRDAAFDFASTWRQSPVLRDLRQRTSLAQTESVCGRCPVRSWCLGGCAGENFAVAGRLEGPSPACAQLRAAVVEMMWTIAHHPKWIKHAVAREDVRRH